MASPEQKVLTLKKPAQAWDLSLQVGHAGFFTQMQV